MPTLAHSATQLAVIAAESLPECLGATFNCADPSPRCQNSARFDFPSLWNITQQIRSQCPQSPLLFQQPGTVGDIPAAQAALTNSACELIAGASYDRYPDYQVWQRFIQWKLPLFQLIATSPRPPLGFWAEAFAIVHLMGDPLGSIQDLIRKTEVCQNRARFWEQALREDRFRLLMLDGEGSSAQRMTRLWRALALITISYDEFGTQWGDSAARYLHGELTNLCNPTADREVRRRLVDSCTDAAKTLAADRSTKLLPIIVAQSTFIAGVVIAIIQTRSSSEGSNPQAYINIGVFSIAFSALYLWAIFAISLASVIGTPQSAEAVPHILEQFQKRVSQEFREQSYPREVKLPAIFYAQERRERYWRGGIYTWQPGLSLSNNNSHTAPEDVLDTAGATTHEAQERKHRPPFSTVLALSSVAFAVSTALALTILVPPYGWSCRALSELIIFAVWLLSYLFNAPLRRGSYRQQFWTTFVKDLLAVGGTLGLVVATQVGIYNRCSCYTGWGRYGLPLPENTIVKAILEYRINAHYPAVTIAGIVVQLLVLPLIVVAKHRGALMVCLQRDDGVDNLQWLLAPWWVEHARSLTGRTRSKPKSGFFEEVHQLGPVSRIDEPAKPLLTSTHAEVGVDRESIFDGASGSPRATRSHPVDFSAA